MPFIMHILDLLHIMKGSLYMEVFAVFRRYI